MKHLSRIGGASAASLLLLIAATAQGATAGNAAKASASQPSRKLQDFAFWRLNAGWWQSENTYFDGAMNYNIRAYGSLVHIELDGRTLRQTEYKFYAPGKMATAIGRGTAKPDEGVETDTVTIGELADDTGLVNITRTSPASPLPATSIRVLTDDSALNVTRDPDAKIDEYRMFITLPSADKRYAANLGIIDSTGKDKDPAHAGLPGDLRGFSLFRATRVDGSQVEALRQALRSKYNVHTIVTADAQDAPKIDRLP